LKIKYIFRPLFYAGLSPFFVANIQSCAVVVSLEKDEKEEVVVFMVLACLRRSDFYGLSWTLSFACKTLYAI
jgi:hypothetical protein